MRSPILGVALVAALLCACGTSTTGTSPTTTKAPLPAGPNPSKLASMVCSNEANTKFNKVLGEHGVVTNRTWDVSTHTYSCSFDYSPGTMSLSVKELSSWAATDTYFNGLKSTLGDSGSIGNLGQGAFRTTNGSIIVRKDWKVLDGNIAGLPATFGVPPTPSTDVAYTVADLVLACWAGD